MIASADGDFLAGQGQSSHRALRGRSRRLSKAPGDEPGELHARQVCVSSRSLLRSRRQHLRRRVGRDRARHENEKDEPTIRGLLPIMAEQEHDEAPPIRPRKRSPKPIGVGVDSDRVARMSDAEVEAMLAALENPEAKS